jgi:non-ribosomal peptide synthetase component F
MISISNQLAHVIRELLTQEDKTLNTIEVTAPEDYQLATKWNDMVVPDLVDSTINELFEKQALARPDDKAVRAWDATLTYGELNSAVNRLAHLLVTDLNVKVDDIVHVCFEKSAWYVVAILAINKVVTARSLSRLVPRSPSPPPRALNNALACSRAPSLLVPS